MYLIGLRLWHKAGLQPHRVGGYMVSFDSQFEADEETAMQAQELHSAYFAAAARLCETLRRRVRSHGTVYLFADLEVVQRRRCSGVVRRATPARNPLARWKNGWRTV